MSIETFRIYGADVQDYTRVCISYNHSAFKSLTTDPTDLLTYDIYEKFKVGIEAICNISPNFKVETNVNKNTIGSIKTIYDNIIINRKDFYLMSIKQICEYITQEHHNIFTYGVKLTEDLKILGYYENNELIFELQFKN